MEMTKMIAVRVDERTKARLAALVRQRRRRGHGLHESDLLRAAVVEFLDAHYAAASPKIVPEVVV